MRITGRGRWAVMGTLPTLGPGLPARPMRARLPRSARPAAYRGRVSRSPLVLAALASSAVPGLDPVSVEGVRVAPGDLFEVAYVQDSQDRRWVVKAPRTAGGRRDARRHRGALEPARATARRGDADGPRPRPGARGSRRRLPAGARPAPRLRRAAARAARRGGGSHPGAHPQRRAPALRGGRAADLRRRGAPPPAALRARPGRCHGPRAHRAADPLGARARGRLAVAVRPEPGARRLHRRQRARLVRRRAGRRQRPRARRARLGGVAHRRPRRRLRRPRRPRRPDDARRRARGLRAVAGRAAGCRAGGPRAARRRDDAAAHPAARALARGSSASSSGPPTAARTSTSASSRTTRGTPARTPSAASAHGGRAGKRPLARRSTPTTPRAPAPSGTPRSRTSPSRCSARRRPSPWPGCSGDDERAERGHEDRTSSGRTMPPPTTDGLDAATAGHGADGRPVEPPEGRCPVDRRRAAPARPVGDSGAVPFMASGDSGATFEIDEVEALPGRRPGCSTCTRARRTSSRRAAPAPTTARPADAHGTSPTHEPG